MRFFYLLIPHFPAICFLLILGLWVGYFGTQFTLKISEKKPNGAEIIVLDSSSIDEVEGKIASDDLVLNMNLVKGPARERMTGKIKYEEQGAQSILLKLMILRLQSDIDSLKSEINLALRSEKSTTRLHLEKLLLELKVELVRVYDNAANLVRQIDSIPHDRRIIVLVGETGILARDHLASVLSQGERPFSIFVRSSHKDDPDVVERLRFWEELASDGYKQSIYDQLVQLAADFEPSADEHFEPHLQLVGHH